jgi:hypothetical protein
MRTQNNFMKRTSHLINAFAAEAELLPACCAARCDGKPRRDHGQSPSIQINYLASTGAACGMPGPPGTDRVKKPHSAASPVLQLAQRQDLPV